jgi:biopolymer transport protein ExbD
VRIGKGSGDYERVEMMMTPMIDVCFQMIIFFVANMRIFSPEGDFNITMPTVAPGAQKNVSDDAQIPPIKIRLRAGKDGNLAGIQMGKREVGTFQNLREQLRQISGMDRGPAAGASNTEVELDFDDNLKYEFVVDAVTAISGYRSDDGHTIVPLIKKIKFAPTRKASKTA